MELVRRWNLFQMNLPVLFRTIDGTSQVTIETQYAARDFGPFGMARAAVYVSLSSKDKDHALWRVWSVSPIGPLDSVVQPLWARSSVG